MGNIDFLLLHFFVAGIGFCLKHESSGKTKVRRQTIEKINIGRHYVRNTCGFKLMWKRYSLRNYWTTTGRAP